MTPDQRAQRALDAREEQGLPRHLDDPEACAFVAGVLLDTSPFESSGPPDATPPQGEPGVERGPNLPRTNHGRA